MSLVNLSHVCSHLQNASLARLGLTSIPYTRLHLSLSLLLQKQGFLSQVKLGGPSPPASCFPPGTRDNARITPPQLGEDGLRSPESALQKMVTGKMTEDALRREGFDDEAITFALEQREKSKTQLEQEGWDEIAADFLLRHDGKTREQLESEGLDATSISIFESHRTTLSQAHAEVQKWHGDRQQFEEQEAENAKQASRTPISYPTHLQTKHRSALLRLGFPTNTLRHFAGNRNRFRTERDLHRDGLTLYAMGLQIPHQTYTPPPPTQHSDPWGLEAEGTVTQANRASRRLWLGLKYWDGMPVLRKARMLSKPTKRIHLPAKDLGRLVRGSSAAKGQIKPLTQVGEVVVVDTPGLGVLEVREAVERRVGGMVLCRIW